MFFAPDGRQPDRRGRGCLTPRAAPRAARVDLGALWIAPPLIVLAVLFLYPLALIAHAAVYDDGGALDLAAAWATLELARRSSTRSLNTAEIALASTAGCLALGLTLALILAFVPFPGATLRRAADRHVHRAADLPGRRSPSPSSTARPACSTAR